MRKPRLIGFPTGHRTAYAYQKAISLVLATQANDKAPWTIKSVPVETRKLAVASATKQGVTMAEWLARFRAQSVNHGVGRPRPAADRVGNRATGRLAG